MIRFPIGVLGDVLGGPRQPESVDISLSDLGIMHEEKKSVKSPGFRSVERGIFGLI